MDNKKSQELPALDNQEVTECHKQVPTDGSNIGHAAAVLEERLSNFSQAWKSQHLEK